MSAFWVRFSNGPRSMCVEATTVSRPDKALTTAQELIGGTVCECGCHREAHDEQGRCNCLPRCGTFRPVQFTVARTLQWKGGK